LLQKKTNASNSLTVPYSSTFFSIRHFCLDYAKSMIN